MMKKSVETKQQWSRQCLPDSSALAFLEACFLTVG